MRFEIGGTIENDGLVGSEILDETNNGAAVCVEESELGELLTTYAGHHGESPDDVLDGQTVVRSVRHPTVVHRVGLTLAEDGYGDANSDPDPSDGPRERGGTGPLPALAHDHDWPEPESLASVGDLRVGDAVAWGTRETPLAVIATEWPLEPEATVRGPDGGTYTLEERGPRDFWVYPSYGRVARVVHFPADPEADPATNTPLPE